MAELFPRIESKIEAGSPLQVLAETIGFGAGPQLLIAEEITGSGKTEAAIVLSHRLMREGRADGLYFALPTMATANAMYERVKRVHRRMFAEGERPSLILAHSSRRMADLGLERTTRDSPYPSGEDTASVDCTTWLGDNRKKALLAPVGVGTIDQALLGVLAARHNTLRLFGLHRHVLIVDEVHAYDPYMSRLIERLLELQAALGGSAVLLSATLPLVLRRTLTRAFMRGLSIPDVTLASLEYPLVTHAAREGVHEVAIPSRAGTERHVVIEFIGGTQEAVDLLVEAAESGQCACWVRNSVNDAIEAFELLRSRLRSEQIILFHARFTMGDRLAIEGKVIDWFGPGFGPHDRHGRVVVATQVVEQSLDLDFDVLVSDIAPIDLLIQRAGRLHRHTRGADGTRLNGTDTRGQAVFHIVSPPWDDAPKAGWVKNAMPRTARIYDDHGRLWLTARVLHGRGAIIVPAEARLLIESVYGEDVESEIPVGLQSASIKAEGLDDAQKAMARLNAINIQHGYAITENQWLPDTVMPTRLGDPTTTLRLALEVDGRLTPFHRGEVYAWELSQVNVLSAMVASRIEGEHEAAIRTAEAEMPDGGRWSQTLVMEQCEAGWKGRALDSKGRTVSVFYQSDIGLTVRRDGGA